MSKGLVVCSICRKVYLKDNRHIAENNKLGHKFYCSSKCQSIYKSTAKQLFCENPSCRKKFKRAQGGISFRNYCSHRCAAVNNKLRPHIRDTFGSTPKSQTEVLKQLSSYCTLCGNKINYGKSFCSMECWANVNKISKETIISKLQELARKLGHTPTKRECQQTTSCYKYFGSWNNALITAGLNPNRSLNQRMYKRRLCKAQDGHLCNSISELLIDNWLFKHHIPHKKEYAYPSGKFTADWMLSPNVFLEYFGLAKNSKRYDEDLEKKRQICKKFGIKLIEIYPKDLFPVQKLAEIFPNI